MSKGSYVELFTVGSFSHFLGGGSSVFSCYDVLLRVSSPGLCGDAEWFVYRISYGSRVCFLRHR